MTIPKVYRGSDFKVVINGVLLAETESITVNVSSPRNSIKSIDTQLTIENTPGSLEVSGSIDFHRIRFVGGLEGRGVIATWDNMTQEKYCTIQIVDRLLQEEYMRIEKVSVTSQSFKISSKSLVGGSFTFTGIKFSTNFNPQD
jgi:hypothetical protein